MYIFFFHLWIFTSKGWKSFSNIAKALILNSQKRRKIESRNFIHHSRCMIFFYKQKKHTKSIEIKINILREGKWRHMTMMRIKGRDHPASIKIQMTFCTAVAASSSLSLFSLLGKIARKFIRWFCWWCRMMHCLY